MFGKTFRGVCLDFQNSKYEIIIVSVSFSLKVFRAHAHIPLHFKRTTLF